MTKSSRKNHRLHHLWRLSFASSLLLAGLVLAPMAQAALVGVTPPLPDGPDIVSYGLEIDENALAADAAGIFLLTSPLSPNEPQPIFNGIFRFSYNWLSETGSLFLGTGMNGTEAPLLTGSVIAAGSNLPNVPHVYDFLVKTDFVDEYLRTAGFGSYAGINLSELANGWQADTFAAAAPVPIPGALLLFGSGLASLAAARRRGRQG